MGLISGIVELIKQAISWIKKVFQYVINGIFNFLAHCVNWFKSLRLDKNRHVPFVANGEQFKDMLKTAPKKNVGIFQGVFDEATDEIVENRFIEADALDSKTREVLGNEDLVVLS
jgi:ribosomal protein L30/L7E